MPASPGIERPVLAVLLIFAGLFAAHAQPSGTYLVPAGTRVMLRMDAEINSGSASVDDTFVAYCSRPVVVNGVPVLRAGEIFEGRVTAVSRAGLGRKGSISLSVNALKLSTGRIAIEAGALEASGVSASTRRRAAEIFGSAAAGAAIGGVLRSMPGALAGAGIGAGIGLGAVLLIRGKEARISKEVEFEIELKRDLRMPVPDY